MTLSCDASRRVSRSAYGVRTLLNSSSGTMVCWYLKLFLQDRRLVDRRTLLRTGADRVVVTNFRAKPPEPTGSLASFSPSNLVAYDNYLLPSHS